MNKLQLIKKGYEEYLCAEDENAAQVFAKEVGRILGLENPDPKRILELYSDNLSISDVAKSVGLPYKLVHQILEKANVIRNHTISTKLKASASLRGQALAAINRIDLPKETLEKLHLTDKLPIKAIARKLGVHMNVIKRNMNAHNIPITNMRGRTKKQ